MKLLEKSTKEGDSPVIENNITLIAIPEYSKTRIAWRNPGELTPKAKYILRSIVN
jgi:hypothetical protein